MALGMNETGIKEEARVLAARARIDFSAPGALEAYQALPKQPTAAQLEALAKRFPIRFRGLSTVEEGRYNAAVQILRERFGKAALYVSTGAEVSARRLPRIPTGILIVDWMLGGGVPRGTIIQCKGAESRGKTTFCLGVAAEVLRRGGRVLWLAAETFDPDWARRRGAPVLFGDAEIGAAPKEAAAAMRAYNTAYAATARLDLLQGRNGNEMLQYVVDAIRMNVYDLVVVDSLAVLRRKWTLDEKDTGDEVRGGEAKLINDFVMRAANEMNWVDTQSRMTEEGWECQTCGEPVASKKDHDCSKGKKKVVKVVRSSGDPVRAAVVVINQLRDRGLDGRIPLPPDATGGWGLKHMKGADIDFQRAEALTAIVDGRPVVYGQTVVCEVVKSKICPPHRRGAFAIFTETVPGLSVKGEIDPTVDLVGTKVTRHGGDEKIAGIGELAGCIRQSGAYYYIGETPLQGIGRLRSFLLDPANRHVLEIIRKQCRDWAADQ